MVKPTTRAVGTREGRSSGGHNIVTLRLRYPAVDNTRDESLANGVESRSGIEPLF